MRKFRIVLLYFFVFQAGPSGSQFGLLACLFVEIFQSWQILANPWRALLKQAGILLILILLGLLPMIDNYAHLTGFLFGLLLAFALLPYLKFGKFDKRRKLITVIVSLLLAISIFVVLIVLFYVTPFYECDNCHYFNCIPFTENFCTNHILSNRTFVEII